MEQNGPIDVVLETAREALMAMALGATARSELHKYICRFHNGHLEDAYDAGSIWRGITLLRCPPYRIVDPAPGTREWARILCEMGATVRVVRSGLALSYIRFGSRFKVKHFAGSDHSFPATPADGWTVTAMLLPGEKTQ